MCHTFIVRRAKELEITPSIDHSIVLEPAEQELIALLNEYPEIIQLAGQEYSPSVIAQYAYDLAKGYNRFFHDVQIFNEESDEKVSMRVALSMILRNTINSALGLMGIDSPEKM